MEWKKNKRMSSSGQPNRAESKILLSIHEKQTKRKKQLKHQKILTEETCQYIQDYQKTKSKNGSFNKNKHQETAFSSQMSSAFSRSYHTPCQSTLCYDIITLGNDFQKENDRIRDFIKTLQLKNNKIQLGTKQCKKESLTQKIKKQNIMLKSTFLKKPSN